MEENALRQNKDSALDPGRPRNDSGDTEPGSTRSRRGSEDFDDEDEQDNDEEVDEAERLFKQKLNEEQRYNFGRIVSGTRMHLPPDAQEIPEATADHLRKYVSQARKLGVVTAIAVNSMVDEVRRIAEEADPELKVHILHVPCWGAFVPALNALLNFAQRFGAKYILFQSLEVCCTRCVLQRLLDHHDLDTLVVGPVFEGHNFRAGEQILDGRSSPWNTLALWSVRKLALTGFLQIADGLPEQPSLGRESGLKAASANDNPQEDFLDPSWPMGSDKWWSPENPQFMRQQSSKPAAVPAGVEEVTAIALLQHLHGSDRSRAVLLQLPPQLEAELSWSASWGKDEGRKKWHKYKMASKVARPAAQLQELFKFKKSVSSASMHSDGGADASGASGGEGGMIKRTGNCLLRRRRTTSLDTPDASEASPAAAPPEAAAAGQGSLTVGKVMHYGESIFPPSNVTWICLTLCMLFYANSTAVLATAFRAMNEGHAQLGKSQLGFVVLLIGGVYLPMPASLWLTRTVTTRWGHMYGMYLCLAFLLLGHLITVCGQALLPQNWWPLLLARLVQGLGSGILFQTRHILAILSTSDNHMDIQSWNFLMSDLGLGFGALFPAAVHYTVGGSLWKPEAPELIPSAVFVVMVLVIGVWVLISFPARLNGLSPGVRFGNRRSSKRRPQRPLLWLGDLDRNFRFTIWISGTTRIFVQSAIVPVVALSMRDAQWTGNYRQTFAVAAIVLLPLPFEVFASRISCSCGFRAGQKDTKDDTNMSKIISGGVGGAALLIAGLQPRSVVGEDGEFAILVTRICELGILMIALGMAAPFNAAKLYQQKDAERSIVILEWMKAYIGRLLGPLFAVLLYSFLGYGPVLGVLALATAVVTLTA